MNPKQLLVPEGFKPLHKIGIYNQQLGPWYIKEQNSKIVLGLNVRYELARDKLGICHGGVLVTIADYAMCHCLHIAQNPDTYETIQNQFVTASLSSDFLSAAKVGDWIEAHTEVIKLGATISVAQCIIRVGDKAVLRSSGSYAQVGQKK